MQTITLNESFKALVRESFPERSEKALSVFEELVNHKATSDSLSVQELKSRAVDELRGELATKDFVRAEIAQTREDLRVEIANAKNEILKWVFGLQAGTIAILIGSMKFILGSN